MRKQNTLDHTIRKRRRRRAWWYIAAGFIILLIAFRIALPYIVLKYVNKKLTEIDGYTGRVRDIDIRLIRGAYKIIDIKLEKTNGKIPVPFFSAAVIDFSVEWKALFKGAIVGEIEAERPALNFVKGPTKATSQTGIDKDWIDVVDDLMPLKINRFAINNGEIHYRDFHSSPKVDVVLDQIYIVASNLNNADDNKEELPSTVKATANGYGGEVTMNMKIAPLKKVPTFDMNIEMKKLDLTKVNDFLKAYGNFDVQKGTFSVYAEAATKENKITGYVKPLISDLDVINWKEERDPVLQKLWESLVGTAGWIFKNHPEDQLATRVNFEGDLNKPDYNIWEIIGETLQNAFIQALMPSIENTVNLAKVEEDNKEEKKGFLKNIFGGKKKEE
jgi:hypothetical protein